MTKQLPNELTKHNVSKWIKQNKDLGSWSTEAIDTSNINKKVRVVTSIQFFLN